MSRYFSSSKRGELHELKEELHSPDRLVIKDAVKKVIAAMTVGKDVSALFPDVVQCMQSSNIEMKKLVYLYVLNYAKTQPELAILAVNTFRKDASDPNPLIRALAVRTMGCIKLGEVIEYLLDPLRRCCGDPDPYVRKTAAICIPKIYEINKDACVDHGFLDILKDMTGDANPMVVANAVSSLLEIQESEGRSDLLVLDEMTVSRLLAALNECTEWGQIAILDALSSLPAKKLTEIETLVERVVPRLNHSNPGVVMGSVKVVVRFIDRVRSNELIRNLQKKLVPPLVSLLATEPEIQYVALRNINLLIQQRPNLLVNEVRMFFCKYTDPIYVKLEKLDILIMLATESNMDAVLAELKEYATEVDVDFVRKAIRGIGKVAVKLDCATSSCISVLLALVETKVNYVVQEAVVVIKDIFRKYPLEYERVIKALCDNIDSLDQPEAKASMIWIIGEHAERIENCDEILLTFAEYFQYEPVIVQLQILTASVKLFLKVPGQGQAVVTKVLQLATEESENPDLRDRAFVYWRLLSTDPEATKKVVLGDKPQIRFESSLLDMDLLEKLVPQLSLMSSVFHRLPSSFITRIASHKSLKQKPVSTNLLDEYDEETEQDRKTRLAQIKAQTGLAERGELRGDSKTGCKEDSSGDDRPADLLGLDSNSPVAATSNFDPLSGLLDSPVKSVNSTLPVVLNRSQPGSTNKATGVEVCASISDDLKLTLMFGNFSSQALNGFAIQMNKNPFGLAPSSSLTVPNIQPGTCFETNITLIPNQLVSDKPAAHPLFLQVALKCSLDVYYFNVPFELPSILTSSGPRVQVEEFDNIWNNNTNQVSFDVNSTKAWNAESLNSAMAAHKFYQVQVVGNVVSYFGTSTKNQQVLLRIAVQGRSAFQVTLRANPEMTAITQPHILKILSS